MRKKINGIRRNILAAGMVCVLTAFAASPAAAAKKNAGKKIEEDTAVKVTEAANSADKTAGTSAVDAQGAEQIAFADAGITEEQAERLRTKEEWENKEAVYEVSFTVDNVEYEYLIREADGRILEWEMDGRDLEDATAEKSLQPDAADGAQAEQGSDTLIGLDRAKSIALDDAGFEISAVGFSKIKFEEDHQEMVYEIEFYQGREEFEYTIDAYTGEILKMERD